MTIKLIPNLFFSYFHTSTPELLRMRRTEIETNTKELHLTTIDCLFELIFKQHEQSVYRLALKVTKSNLIAADIVQEVFINIWEHRADLQQVRNIDAWINRIVRNKLIDFMRKVSADERLKSGLWNRLKDMQQPVESMVEMKESDHLLRKAVDELPEQRKLVYRLNREAGLTYHQIAEELSISKHTVKNQLSLALRFLQKKLSFE